MTEHTDTLIHSGWTTPTSADAPIATPADIAHFRRSLPLLSPQERRILNARASGLSLPEIAAAYYMSERRVKGNVTRTLAKLGLSDGVGKARITRAAYLLGRVDGGQ